MEKYEKPVMEVVDVKDNAILTSGGNGVTQCTGIFSYCGSDNSCSNMFNDAM